MVFLKRNWYDYFIVIVFIKQRTFGFVFVLFFKEEFFDMILFYFYFLF